MGIDAPAKTTDDVENVIAQAFVAKSGARSVDSKASKMSPCLLMGYTSRTMPIFGLLSLRRVGKGRGEGCKKGGG